MLVTRREKSASLRRTEYTSGCPPFLVHQPPGKSSVRPLGRLRHRSTISSSHTKNRVLSLLPAGHERDKSPSATSPCLASARACCSASVAGIISCPSALATSVELRTSGRSAPSAEPVERATRRRSLASGVSIPSASKSMNAGVSQTAPGTAGMAGPPKGPHKPARSSAPRNRFRGAIFPAPPPAVSPPFRSRSAAPDAPPTTPASPSPPAAA